MRLRVLLVLVLLIGTAAVSVWRGWVSLPPQWNPWAPLDVKATPNLLTRYKLMRLRDDPPLCDQALSSSGLSVTHLADSPDAKCPLTNTLRVQGGDVALSSSFLASCRLAVSFALFERHALQPAAQAAYGQAVTRVDHLGSFACRNVYGRENGRLSSMPAPMRWTSPGSDWPMAEPSMCLRTGPRIIRTHGFCVRSAMAPARCSVWY